MMQASIFNHVEEIRSRDLANLNAQDQDNLVAAIIYARDWLSNDKQCDCQSCFINRTLCTAILTVTESKNVGALN